MKDFTEITLCPEALERSEVGLGQGCHPMGLHSASSQCHAPLLLCRLSSATPSLRVRSPWQCLQLSSHRTRMGWEPHHPRMPSVPAWGLYTRPCLWDHWEPTRGVLSVGVWGCVGNCWHPGDKRLGSEGGTGLGTWQHPALPSLLALSRPAALGAGGLAVPCRLQVHLALCGSDECCSPLPHRPPAGHRHPP